MTKKDLNNELGEYKKLEEKGLLLHLPCNFNDDLYWIEKGKVRKIIFKGIRCDKGFKPQIIGGYVDVYTTGDVDRFRYVEKPITLLDNIGKTLFLSLEEAEVSLANIQRNEYAQKIEKYKKEFKEYQNKYNEVGM